MHKQWMQFYFLHDSGVKFIWCLVQGGTHWTHWALALEAVLDALNNLEDSTQNRSPKELQRK